MPEVLTIRCAGAADNRITLERRMARIGSDPACEINVGHAEVAPHAATIDYRGGVYLFQNLNPFPVYLDSQMVSPEQWVPWAMGQEVRLTRSVSLKLESAGQAVAGGPAAPGEVAEEAAAAAPGKSRKQLIQAIVIAACFGGSVLLLTTEDTSSPAQSTESLQQLVADCGQKKDATYQDQVILKYLQEAWIADRRSGGGEAAVRSYQLLLNHPKISSAPTEGTSLESRIKQFASRRLASIDAS